MCSDDVVDDRYDPLSNIGRVHRIEEGFECPDDVGLHPRQDVVEQRLSSRRRGSFSRHYPIAL